jgi:hypothetical protein
MILVLLVIVFYLSLFEVGDDSWINFFQERGDDASQTTPKDSLEVIVGSITNSRSKKLKDAFNDLI